MKHVRKNSLYQLFKNYGLSRFKNFKLFKNYRCHIVITYENAHL